MSYKGLSVLVFSIAIFFIACNSDPEPISLEGDYGVTILDISNCNDSTENRFFSIDSNFCFLDTFVGFERCLTTAELTFTDDTYQFDKVLDENGVITEDVEMGTYSRVDNNNFVFCNPVCDTVFVVLDGQIINIVMSDTLIGCGTLIRAIRN
ncbi:hypothetical protein N9L92_04300 [Saprospiraceae bacterium]|nr:hypothetical protein [Saprospiraceae bacterium]